MSQAAVNLSDEYSITILTLNTPQNENKNAISSQHEEAIGKLTDWLGRVRFLSRLQYTVLPLNRLHHKERLVLKFSLSPDYTSHFALLKGLFEFGRPKGILVSSDRFEKTFAVEVVTEHAETAIVYFGTIIGWFAREIKFKETLRQVIDWEHKVRLQQQSLFAALIEAIR